MSARAAASLVLFGAALSGAVAACAGPVVIDAAPYAGDARCAAMMLAVPEEVGGLTMRSTSSQATAAYGEAPELVVRCGVEPPGPSNEACVAIETATTAQDWLVTETDDAWVAVSFGRSPALEVTIPKARVDQALGEMLAQFSGPASMADANGLECR